MIKKVFEMIGFKSDKITRPPYQRQKETEDILEFLLFSKIA
jgi:hypothetical protein